MRSDERTRGDSEPVGVAIACAYTFVLAHTAGAIVLLPAPVFPFTALGMADHWAERRYERAASGAAPSA